MRPDIVVVNLGTGNWTNLTQDDAWDAAPAWSPTGERVAFWSDRNGDDGFYVVDVATLEVDGPLPGTSGVTEVDWSPDGSTLAWADGGLFTLDMTTPGARPTEIPGGDVRDLYGSWSPDGTRISFSSNRGTGAEIFSIALDGSDLIQHTATPDIGESDPDWQAVFVELSASQTDLVLGDSAELLVHLHPYASTTNTSITLLRSVAGKPFESFLTSDVDGAGDLVVPVTPSRNTRYVARWSGDETTTAASSGRVDVLVQASFRARLRGAFRTDGDYLLFHAGDIPRLAVRLLPYQPGKSVYVAVERKRTNSWDTVADGKFATARNGRLLVSFVGFPAGLRFRVVTGFNGSFRNEAAAADPILFRLVR